MVYTLRQRIEMIFIYGEQGRCARRTAEVFNNRNPNCNVSHRYILDVVAKFNETGSVGNKKRASRRVLNEDAQVEILGTFVAEPTNSLRTVARLTGMSHETELHEDDFDRRIEFCEIMSNLINTRAIVNCRYWSEDNPHIFREGATQRPQKINVWAGILGNAVIGPLFIEQNLTGELYLHLLEDVIDPLITTELENQVGNILQENELHFQQDGATPHYFRPVREWLNNRFPNQWIGRRGPIECGLLGHHYLTPLDFFLWGHIKSVVYKTQPDDIEDLKRRITEASRAIPEEVFQNVREEFENRLYFCLENNGEHFEHLLK
ncbi:uncharacterized protein LOC126735594 isoform X2 [Anthonomus grandis grandis]|uniref:uncharacterized protein LOC126735594 isoform X2 n=1 Tax=Anthonomus grandis grandis TaxID=2921223 RepID=UPI00216651BD|nr:uncharacterized protein LOC126735594 isoform X2 [Anthonomus grandis grandis]